MSTPALPRISPGIIAVLALFIAVRRQQCAVNSFTLYVSLGEQNFGSDAGSVAGLDILESTDVSAIAGERPTS